MSEERTEPAPFRAKKLAAISRNGLYWVGGQAWSSDIRQARIYPFDQAARKEKIDIGLDDCELLEIEPVAVKGVKPFPLAKLQEAKRAERPWPTRLRRK